MRQLKRWQEPLYGIGGFGNGLMYQVAMSYLITYYVPTMSDVAKGAIILAPAGLFGILFFLSRMLDGVVDIPIANWTDNLRSKWGRRRPFMLLGFIPMVITYALLWFPPVIPQPSEGGSVANVIYLALISVFFFFFYTMATVPYLSALSEIVPDERSRVRVASWQTFFNTISYVLAYVLVPILFSRFGIRNTVLMLLPVTLTFLFPLFVLKEDSTLQGVTKSKEDTDPGIIKSFGLTLQNKNFLYYLLTLATFYFGLQLFLGGIKYIANDVMGLGDASLGLMNAAAFAPVPLMLLLFNIITKRKGSKTAFRASLLVFAVSMLVFPLGWTGISLPLPPIVIGMIAGVIGSFSMGAFFTIPYAYPAQIGADEAALTGRDRTGMYFAVQGLVNQIIGALAGSLVLANLVGIRSEVFGTGALFIGPIAALACIVSFFFAKKIIIGGKATGGSSLSEPKE